MQTHLIVFALTNIHNNLAAIHQAITNVTSTALKLTPFTWVVQTEQTANEVWEAVLPALDSQDQLSVFTLTGEWATFGLSQEHNEWLRQYLNSEVQ